MAKWMPMITGALKEGAQKLLSVFTKNKTDVEAGGSKESDSFTKGMPVEELMESKPDPNAAKESGAKESPNLDKTLKQPREIERPQQPPWDNSRSGGDPGELKEGEAPISGPHPTPKYDTRNAMPALQAAVVEDTHTAEIHKYAEKDKASQESSEKESQRERQESPDPERLSEEWNKQVKDVPELPGSTPEPTKPETPQSSLPDLPEWPKAVMESSGMGAGSHFGPSGILTTTQPPGGQLQGQLTEGSAPAQQAAQQTAPIQQPQGMMAAEQVVGGYNRTERLLELMLLRGIPTLKPPRGP